MSLEGCDSNSLIHVFCCTACHVHFISFIQVRKGMVLVDEKELMSNFLFFKAYLLVMGHNGHNSVMLPSFSDHVELHK